MRPRIKVWLEKTNQPVFGKGREELLLAIDELGSIAKAAEYLKMSYRAAWGKIKTAEERLGKRLVVREIGGKGGGGAKLTKEGKKILSGYHQLRKSLEEELNRNYRRFF